MGQAEQFAKQTFAEETTRDTYGAMTWKDPPEIGLLKLLSVQGDGLLFVQRQELLIGLVAPWSAARGYKIVLVAIKMPGDHLDVLSVEQAMLGLQALRVQRVEEKKPPWPRAEILCLVAPHVPSWLREERKLRRVGRGCYLVGPSWAPFLWVAANELPLRDELVPFLVARSGRALDKFARWVAPRRPVEWVLNMIEYTSMSMPTREELVRRFGKSDDPEIEARRQRILEILLEESPQMRQQLTEKGIEKGQLVGVRAALRRVLARRQLVLASAEEARIEACDDLATLERWHDQSVTAASVAEALR